MSKVRHLNQMGKHQRQEIRAEVQRMALQGVTAIAIAAALKISKSTAWKWVRQLRNTGALEYVPLLKDRKPTPTTDVIGIVTMAERVEIYRGRYERGEELWSPHDENKTLDGHARRALHH